MDTFYIPQRVGPTIFYSKIEHYLMFLNPIQTSFVRKRIYLASISTEFSQFFFLLKIFILSMDHLADSKCLHMGTRYIPMYIHRYTPQFVDLQALNSATAVSILLA